MSPPTAIVPAAGETLAASLPGLDALWAETQGDPDICVAILDGPVDLSHPCFEGARLTPLETLASGAADDGPATAHGTHVASVIFGQPGCEIQGIAPGCRGLILPVFESRGDGIAPCSQIDLARAISQAVEHGAHVINISGGELSPSDEPHPLLARAIRHCADNEVLVVAAAGNDGCDCLHVPAAAPSVLGVGAMNTQGEPLGFSNWGAVYQTQGILAPGEQIVGALPGGGTIAHTGTSFATPIVSGVIALLLSLQRRQGRRPSPHTVRHAILSSAVGCDEEPVAECRRLLAGRLDLVGALHHLTQGGSIDMAGKNKKTEKGKAEEPAAAPVAPPAPSPVLRAAAPPAPSMSPAIQPAWMPYTPSFVAPSSCGCGGGATCTCGARPQLVYPLGTLNYDFGSEARRDAFEQLLQAYSNRFDLKWGDNGKLTPYDQEKMLTYLGNGTKDDDDEPGKAPSYAPALIWTLEQETTPIYAIQPAGPFAANIYKWLRRYLYQQINDEANQVCIPGVIHGKVTLLNGQEVPVIIPEQRGMWAWSTQAWLKDILKEEPEWPEGEEEPEPLSKPVGATRDTYKEEMAEYEEYKEKKKQYDAYRAYHDKRNGLIAILYRIYYEIRSLGLTSQERAVNHAATDAHQIMKTLRKLEPGAELNSIEVEQSPLCRPGSDCWDVKLVFFFPDNVNKSNKVARFTIDVSDVIPVTVGEVRIWSER